MTAPRHRACVNHASKARRRAVVVAEVRHSRSTCWHGFDDAIYVAMRLLGILGRSELSLAEIADWLPAAFNTPELRFDCDEARKFAIVAEIAERLRRRDAEVIDVDGVRVKKPDGWWTRASNTQAIVVERAEGQLARRKYQDSNGRQP